ncbi:MAG TPA: hypothetical protein VJ201_01470 [Candidatus Babeliales bacterium]|nr:hypothetical protein [Candidatus Babeliales bacterium]
METKNKNILQLIILCTALLIYSRSTHTHSITLIAKRHPAHTRHATQKLLMKKPTYLPPAHLIPHYVAHHMVTLPGYIGLCGTYAGYLAITDRIGQMTFPKKQQQNSLELIITQKIVPVTYQNSKLIHHWEVVPEEKIAVYQVDKQQDSVTKNYFWNVKKSSQIRDNIIPLHSIVLFADPKSIYIPEGVTSTNDSPNLILPTIYFLNSFDAAHNSLYTLSIRRFFETPELFYKNRPYGYAQLEGTID